MIKKQSILWFPSLPFHPLCGKIPPHGYLLFPVVQKPSPPSGWTGYILIPSILPNHNAVLLGRSEILTSNLCFPPKLPHHIPLSKCTLSLAPLTHRQFCHRYTRMEQIQINFGAFSKPFKHLLRLIHIPIHFPIAAAFAIPSAMFHKPLDIARRIP